jgi:beta-glucosidase
MNTKYKLYTLLLLAAVPAVSALAADAVKKTAGNEYSDEAAKTDRDVDAVQRSKVEGAAKNEATSQKIEQPKESPSGNHSFLDLNKNGRMDPYENPDLPVAQRVEDLVARMTPEELIERVGRAREAAIPRLGLPQFSFLCESSHGAFLNITSTIFPHSIGQAASWNPELMGRIATVMGTEGRASYGKNGQDFGLSFWSPVVDMGRDPRWGRLQESYGEDPLLSGRLGVAYSKGVQGNDPHYFRVIATPKHFVANSTEFNRHTGSSDMDMRNLREYYLKPFQACIVEGGAFSIMGAYNRLNGVPCNADKWLLTDVLRGDWGFQGFVVSDCSAIANISGEHHYAKTPGEAFAKALRAGCDLDGLDDMYKGLKTALEKGEVTVDDLRTAAKRVLTAQFRLGIYDPADRVPYSQLSLADVNTPANQAVSLDAARQSLVLLRNQDGLLPLDANKAKSIALIGPYVNKIVYGNYCRKSSFAISPFAAIAKQLGVEKVIRSYGRIQARDYDEATVANGGKIWSAEPEFSHTGGGLGVLLDWVKEATLIYRNCDLTGAKSITLGLHGLKGAFSVELHADRPDGPQLARIDVPKQTQGEWLRYYDATIVKTEGVHDLVVVVRAAADHGNGICTGFSFLEINKPDAHGPEAYAAHAKGEQPRLTFSSGCGVPWIEKRMPKFIAGRDDYKFDEKQIRSVNLAGDDDRTIAEAVAAAKAADVAVLFVGLDTRHMDEGLDRDALELPGRQNDLIKAVIAANPKTVVVLKVGGPITGDWLTKDAKTVLCAWYPCMFEGQVISEALFGQINPGGRTPVTWYEKLSDLPEFTNYNIRDGLTYQYFPGKALFPFGHGLSYTTFTYENLKLSDSKVDPAGSLTLSLDVTNAGERDGDEVVQVYVHQQKSSLKVPLKQLKGFERISLKKGEKRTVTVTLPVKEWAIWDEITNAYKVEPGQFDILVGSSSDDIRLHGVVEVK